LQKNVKNVLRRKNEAPRRAACPGATNGIKPWRAVSTFHIFSDLGKIYEIANAIPCHREPRRNRASTPIVISSRAPYFS
jgi:hypothetical protein